MFDHEINHLKNDNWYQPRRTKSQQLIEFQHTYLPFHALVYLSESTVYQYHELLQNYKALTRPCPYLSFSWRVRAHTHQPAIPHFRLKLSEIGEGLEEERFVNFLTDNFLLRSLTYGKLTFFLLLQRKV